MPSLAGTLEDCRERTFNRSVFGQRRRRLVGGTGPRGLGLDRRLATTGVQVMLGSRNAERAAEAAAGLPGQARGGDNESCTATCDIAIVAVPYDGHRTLLRAVRSQLTGKLVIDCVNPLGFDGKGPFALLVSRGERLRGGTGGTSGVCRDRGLPPPLCRCAGGRGDERWATDWTQQLAEKITGVRAIFAGRLRNAHQVEAMTANLIVINRRYKAHAALRVTDILRM
ncbi:NAD(P)-binding domain-containing protein [Blastococcus sp. SYSU D00669]